MTKNDFNAFFSKFLEKHPYFSIWITLAILYLLICSIRIWYSLAFAGPQSLGDATAYDFIARSIVDGTFISAGAYANTYPPGYPFLLSISYLFGPDKIIIYHAQLALNALVAGLILFPAYWFLRDWCTQEVALAGSVIIATLPSISRTTGLIMSESLFIPLIFFTLYLIYMAFKTEKQYIALIAGFLCFYAFFTRSTGIAMLMALVCGLIWYCYLNQKISGSYIKSLRKQWGLLAGSFIPFGLWEVLLIGTGKPAIGYDQDTIVTTYVSNIGTEFVAYLKVILFQVDYVILVSYSIGVILAIYAIYLILRGDITSVLKQSEEESKEKERALKGVVGVAVPLLAFLALTPIPLTTAVQPYMYGRFYDPLIPILFLFATLGVQYLISKKSIPRSHAYSILGTSIIAAVFVVLTLQWNPHFDILQNAALPYLYLLPPFLGIGIIILLFGIILPIFLLAGIKHVQVMRSFFLLILAMNIIISIPMIQTEIQFSNNFDNIGVIGKVIHHNIDPDAVIIWDNSSMEPPWNVIFYDLIDYWIENDLRSVNVANIALSGDYSALEGGDYIITMLEGSTEPIYISPSGLSLYYL